MRYLTDDKSEYVGGRQTAQVVVGWGSHVWSFPNDQSCTNIADNSGSEHQAVHDSQSDGLAQAAMSWP